MTAGEMIALGSALLALVSLVVQQTRVIAAERRNQQRTTNKLKILYLCQNEGLTEQQIVDAYRRAHPTEAVDLTEIRKTVYDMLCDRTLVFIADSGTYEVVSHSSRKRGKS
jgi:hypothetical protein